MQSYLSRPLEPSRAISTLLLLDGVTSGNRDSQAFGAKACIDKSAAGSKIFVTPIHQTTHSPPPRQHLALYASFTFLTLLSSTDLFFDTACHTKIRTPTPELPTELNHRNHGEKADS